MSHLTMFVGYDNVLHTCAYVRTQPVFLRLFARYLCGAPLRALEFLVPNFLRTGAQLWQVA
jgi:hypothetical protein